MFKKLMAILCILALLAGGVIGCGKNEEKSDSKDNMLFSKKDTDKANKDNTEAYINGKKVDEKPVKDFAFDSDSPKGLPKGFPKEIPFFKNAEIIEADTFGSDGFTVVYSVNEKYKKVVDFYVNNLALDKSTVGEEESYFEAIDINNIHINGITITDIGDGTHVFITLRDYGKKSEDEDQDEDINEDADAEAYIYDDIDSKKLDKKYPNDVVPIYPKAKVLDASFSPSEEMIHVELVIPPNAYKDAVSFYKKELELKPESFKSDLMVSETYEGIIGDWNISVTVAEIKAGKSDPFVSISLEK